MKEELIFLEDVGQFIRTDSYIQQLDLEGPKIRIIGNKRMMANGETVAVGRLEV